MPGSAYSEILRLEGFSAAFPVEPGREEDTSREFRTLFAANAAPTARGGNGRVMEMRNYRGERFALKFPRNFGEDAGAAGNDYAERLFFEEYRTLCALPGLRGFPRVFGTGIVEGTPVMVMEWVEGETLARAIATWRKSSGIDQENPAPPVPLETVARLGTAACGTLESARGCCEGFVHRDLSPANIMLRTENLPVSEQVETGEFDLCLVDLGSSTAPPLDPSFTQQAGAYRLGTPEYAPPEMLTDDVDLPHASRQSETIDVYALCSVLYELYHGHTPYRLAASPATSPYRAKTQHPLPPATPREGDGGALARIIEAGLALEQNARPTVAQLHVALENWLADPQAREDGALAPTAGRRFERGLWQPDYARSMLTRRRFTALGILAAGVIVSAALVGGKLLHDAQDAPDTAALPTTDAVYNGEPLYKVFDGARPGWALANAQGDVVCKPDSSRECGRLSEGVVVCFHDPTGAWGFIVPAADGSYAWKVPPRYARAGDFHEGLAAAQDRESKLWGFIDTQGNWNIPPQFNAAHDFSNGVAAVQDTRSGLWGTVLTDGAWGIEPRFEALGARSADDFAAAQAHQDDGQAGAWGVAGADGEWAALPAFSAVRRFGEGCAPAQADADAPWGFVGSDGAWMLEPQFADARPFSSGLAAVQDAKTLLWGLISPPDGSGDPRWQVEPRFWKLGELVDALAPAQARADDDTVAFDDGERVEGVGMRYGYVDAKGNWQMKRLATLVDVALGASPV